MRIAFFTDAYPPQINGVATTVEELRGSLVAREHKVYIVAPAYPKFKEICPDVLRLRSVRLWKNPELRVSYMFPDRILQKVLQLDVDIVHGFSGGATTTRETGIFPCSRFFPAIDRRLRIPGNGRS